MTEQCPSRPPRSDHKGWPRMFSGFLPLGRCHLPQDNRGRLRLLLHPGTEINAGGSFFTAGRRSYVDPPFEITLIYEGRQVRHEVSEILPVSTLMIDVGRIFRIDPNALILMLFSASPAILNRTLTLQGPPWVGPNSSLFVFVVATAAEGRLTYPAMGGEARFQPEVAAVPKMHSNSWGLSNFPSSMEAPRAGNSGIGTLFVFLACISWSMFFWKVSCRFCHIQKQWHPTRLFTF
jgi:hypothetical protein